MKLECSRFPDFVRKRVCTVDLLCLYVLTACVWTAPRAPAAVTEAWVQRYNNIVSNSVDEAFKLAIDPAGDVIVTGMTDEGTTGADVLTVKYSGGDGSVIWQRRYDGPGSNSDAGQSIAVDTSGNIVVGGRSVGLGTGRGDYYVGKYAGADGTPIWVQRYNSPSNRSDFAWAVATDANGDVAVTGESFSRTWDEYTAKYSGETGALLWERKYNDLTDQNDHGRNVIVDSVGNVVVTGYSESGVSYTAKYAAEDGALLWEKRATNRYHGAPALAVDVSDNIVVAAGWNQGFSTVRYSASGGLLWERHYDGTTYGAASPQAVAVDADGNVIVTGYSTGIFGNLDYYTVKYAAADGVFIWERRYNGSANGKDTAAAVAVDRWGNVIVTGSSAGTGTDADYYTAKYAALDGTVIWERRYNGPANRLDAAQAVVLDTEGNAVVTGSSSMGNHNDFFTVKYSGVDGAVLWARRYNAAANRNDISRAVTVDAVGNVVVTGSSWNATNSDYLTTRYSATGTVLWQQRQNGAANSNDTVQALAMDSRGNVAVTGSSYNRAGNSDYYTVKYASTGGALLWETRYNGPNNGDDKPIAAAADALGNVVVTGASYNTLGVADYYTAKYAADNGALLWEKRYNGLGNNADLPVAMAIESNGTVVITGRSWNGQDYESYTVKYAGSDGNIVWEKRRPDGLRIQALAVHSSGDVVTTGYRHSPVPNVYYDTVKFRAADGALLWEKAGPVGGAYAVAMDSNGDVVVTGSVSNNYYTIKYAGADGAVLWEKQGPRGDARCIATQDDGNVIVGGSSWNGTDYDFYTAKYASANGSLLWEHRYNGPANRNDFATNSQSLAINRHGVVAVTGFSDAALGGVWAYDFVTLVHWESLPPLSLDVVPSGVRIRMSGVAGRNYELQRAAALVGPWATIATQTAPSHGTLEYFDIDPAKDSLFYRMKAD